ncbi:MAG TPA: DUF4236 domain-containing protein [Candidatus Limnocylindrales bacterium]|nr:DUF4236 domain-containing protein [Candidatus Limnocylindrales bacterium]
MGVRFRRSIKIAPGIKLNVTKTGLGLTAGVRGAHYSVHSSGRRTVSVGVPGTGLYAQSVSGRKSPVTPRSNTTRRADSDRSTPAPAYVSGAQAAAILPKAGLFASASEKKYREGLVHYLTGNKAAAASAMEAVLAMDPRAGSAHLIAAVSIEDDAEAPRITDHLEALISSQAKFPDKYMAKFLSAAQSNLYLEVKITELIHARVPFDTSGATLLLAEAYQFQARLEDAIGIIQQLHDASPSDPAIRLSLADLLLADGDFEGVVEVTRGAANVDDLNLALIHMRAAALTALGHQTAAFEAFKDALSKTAKRDGALLNAIRYDRALAYETSGQRARAKADFERIFAVDSSYQDVRERLAALA